MNFINGLRARAARLGGAVALLVLVSLTGCAVNKTLDEAQEQRLLQRATERWEALVERDWEGAYRFTSPAYKAVFSKELYARKFSYMVEWELTAVELVNYDAGAAVASVAVRVMSRPVKQTSAASVAIGAVPTRIVEQWILIEDEWWYSANL